MKANQRSLTVKIPVGCPVVHLEHKELGKTFSVFFNETEHDWEVNITDWFNEKQIYQNFIPKERETK